MDFKSAKELLGLCHENHMAISEVMKRRECTLGETTLEQVQRRMGQVLDIMRNSALAAVENPRKSMGGLIGGEAEKLSRQRRQGKTVGGPVFSRAVMYAMGVLEVNASMGLIVAAPTAGSSGVVPGLLLALQEEYQVPDEKVIAALFNAGAIGYLAMRNATVAGAVGGCQAEIGVASAMADRKSVV